MKHVWRQVSAAIAVMALVGCDGGGNSSLGDGHDFGSNNANRYVVMGDSISANGPDGVSWPTLLAGDLGAGKEVIDEARGGETAADAVGRTAGVLSNYRPGFLLILYGANDVITGSGNEEALASLRSMVEMAKANQTIPVIATLTPMIAVHSIFDGAGRQLSAMIVQMAAEENITVVRLDQDFGTGTGFLEDDGLHPNDAGRQIIAQAFASVLL